jgi:ABC-type multidrug transport system permease subunit
MLRDSLFIARKDIQYMLRARETILWVFVMPIVFFYFIGTITGGYGRGPAARENLAVKTQGETGFLFQRLVKRLEERGYQIVETESDSSFARYARRLTVPAGFTDSLMSARPVTLRFARTESGMGFDYDTIRIRRAMYTTLADIIVAREAENGVSPEALERLDAIPRALRLDVSPAGQRRIVPSGFQQAVPGIMVMFTLLVMTTSGAILLVIERRQGLLKRLAYTPIDRVAIALGKWSGKLSLGVVQVGFAMVSGTVLFKMQWGSNIAMVIVVMVAYGGLMASLGLLLGSVARNEGQAAAIGVISANVLAALGGCWWPIEVTPAWMQKLQLLLPTGWAMDALHKLVSFGASPAAVLPHVALMTVAALALLVLSTRLFRFE